MSFFIQVTDLVLILGASVMKVLAVDRATVPLTIPLVFNPVMRRVVFSVQEQATVCVGCASATITHSILDNTVKIVL